MGLYTNRENNNGKTTTPVWFMRQAGRYHSHYQNIKKNSDFMTMCKTPELACEITMGPMDEFNFDAAILFSDLLFPLEILNMGLTYQNGPPELSFKVEDKNSLQKLNLIHKEEDFFKFQADAISLLKNRLASTKTLLGFVGAPFTLYSYAVEGSHSGNLTSSKKGFYDGRFQGFVELLLPTLIENMKIQARAGADGICLFDTAVGELDLDDFKEFVLPVLRKVTASFKAEFPDTKVTYYSKLTHLHYFKEIQDDNIDVLGVDWRCDLPQVLNELGNDYYIQGNLDPSHLHLEWNQLETKLNNLKRKVFDNNNNLDKWIMGLGHGVLQHTPESNVKDTISFIHENFIY